MKNYKFYLFLMLLNFSCKKDNLNAQNNKNNTEKKDTIITDKQIVDKFKDINSWVYEFNQENDLEQYYEMEEDDMKIVEYLILEDLKKKKYNFPDQVLFNKRINQIFGNIKDNPSNFVYNNFIIITAYNCQNSNVNVKKCQEEAKKGSFISDKNIFVFKNFITLFPYIRQMAVLKNDRIITTIPEDYYHINQFLFYNNKNSLRWLKENNKDFLEYLITKFNYTEDKELLNWYISNNNWIGEYKISPMIVSQHRGEELEVTYLINIDSDNHAILNIESDLHHDRFCQGEHILMKEDDVLHAVGKCKETGVEDFYIKKENDKYFIKSRRFVNEDWQELIKL